MHELAAEVREFNHIWRSERAIQADTVTFVEHTNHIFNTLSTQIDREDRELYRIADGLE